MFFWGEDSRNYTVGHKVGTKRPVEQNTKVTPRARSGLYRPLQHARGQKSQAQLREGELPGVQKMIPAFLTQMLPAVAAISATGPTEMHTSEIPNLMRYMYALRRWLERYSGARVR